MDGYRALLIGNSTFPVDAQNLQDLNGPVKDVALLGAALVDREVGLFDNEHVTLLVERPAGRVIEEIEAFLLDARRDDLLLLYYSGHGLLDERNRLYLAAANTRIDRLRSTAVSAADVSEMLDNSAARAAVILLDCCHSGAFKGSIGPANLAGVGRFVLTSCRSGELANDADRRNGTSLFTQYLVEGLMGGAPSREGDGRVDLDELYRYVHDRLTETNRQIPQRRYDGSARTPSLARRPLPAVAPPLAPPTPPPPAHIPKDVSPQAVATVAPTPPTTTAPPNVPATGMPTTGEASTSSGRAELSWASRLSHGRQPVVIALVVTVVALAAAVVSLDARRDGGATTPTTETTVATGSSVTSTGTSPPPPPVLAQSPEARSIFLDAGGNLYIADTGNNRVVRVAASAKPADRTVTLVAGTTSAAPGEVIDGRPATQTGLYEPHALSAFSGGGFVMANTNSNDGSSRVLSVGPTGVVRQSPTEDRLGPKAKIKGLAAAPDGRVYVATDQKVFLVDLAPGNVGQIAGTDTPGFSGDGNHAAKAQLKLPRAVALDREGKSLYIADCENDRVRRVDLVSNEITTFAGGGPAYEEGGLAAQANLSCPYSLTVGPDNAVYLATDGSIRKVANGRITTAAGPVKYGSSATVAEDGHPATQTSFGNIQAIAVDGENRLYVLDGNRVRRVAADGSNVETYI